MKTVTVVGLGLMGGSIAKALSSADYKVIGSDLNESVCRQAMSEGAISSVWDMQSSISCDIMILCVAPRIAKEFLMNKLHLLSSECIVTDICGVKREIVALGEKKAEEFGLHFVGGHPMAGRERSGYEFSTKDLFVNRSYILTKTDATNADALETMKSFALDIGCSDITVTTPEEHDRMIAFTSQIPHVLAGAYIKSPQSDSHKGFSAGSYHDVSRVASVDENLWTELFVSNSDYLISELDTLIDNLSEYKKALEKNDVKAVKEAVKRGRLLKERDINLNGTEKPHKFG